MFTYGLKTLCGCYVIMCFTVTLQRWYFFHNKTIYVLTSPFSLTVQERIKSYYDVPRSSCSHNHKPFPHAPPHNQTHTNTHCGSPCLDCLSPVSGNACISQETQFKKLKKLSTSSALAVFPSVLISVCINSTLTANVKQTWVWCQLVTVSLRQSNLRMTREKYNDKRKI